jgi:predicted DCC family thiol-disulfide oxidoreductase YuxK
MDDLEYLNIDHSRVRREVLFLSGSGTTLYGHEAIAAVLKTGALPWRLLGHVITLRPINRLSALVYRTVSRHRHSLRGA